MIKITFKTFNGGEDHNYFIATYSNIVDLGLQIDFTN